MTDIEVASIEMRIEYAMRSGNKRDIEDIYNNFIPLSTLMVNPFEGYFPPELVPISIKLMKEIGVGFFSMWLPIMLISTKSHELYDAAVKYGLDNDMRRILLKGGYCNDDIETATCNMLYDLASRIGNCLKTDLTGNDSTISCLYPKCMDIIDGLGNKASSKSLKTLRVIIYDLEPLLRSALYTIRENIRKEGEQGRMEEMIMNMMLKDYLEATAKFNYSQFVLYNIVDSAKNAVNSIIERCGDAN